MKTGGNRKKKKTVMKNLIIQTKKKMVRINSNLQKDNTQKIINSNNINSLVANVQPSKFAILKK